MLKWHKNMLIHTSIEDIELLKKQIEDKEKILGVYCIIDTLNGKNLFEIVSVVELFNVFYKEYLDSKDKEIVVLAIAKGKKNIKEMLVSLVQNLIDEEGLIDKNRINLL